MNVMRLEKGYQGAGGLIDEPREAGVPGFVPLYVSQVLAGPGNFRQRKVP